MLPLLSQAAKYGNIDVVRYLIRNGASLKATDSQVIVVIIVVIIIIIITINIV